MLHSVHRSGAPYSMMSVSSFPILQVLARFLHPLIFKGGLMSAHSGQTGHFLTLFQNHWYCENSFCLNSVHPRRSKWANSFGKVAVQVQVNIYLPAHYPPAHLPRSFLTSGTLPAAKKSLEPFKQF